MVDEARRNCTAQRRYAADGCRPLYGHSGGLPEGEGMTLLLRSMSPDIIAVDELGRREDVAAVEEVLNAGVKLIATAHGRDFADIETRPQLRALVRRKIFERYLFLSNRNGTGTIEGLCDREGKMIAEEEMTMKKEEEA